MAWAGRGRYGAVLTLCDAALLFANEFHSLLHGAWQMTVVIGFEMCPNPALSMPESWSTLNAVTSVKILTDP